MQYLHERRKALGGYVPSRATQYPKLETPPIDDYRGFIEKSGGDKEGSTTMAFVRLLAKLLNDKKIGK